MNIEFYCPLGETNSCLSTSSAEKRLRSLAAAGPEFISSQTGRDFFEFEDNLALLFLAVGVSEGTDRPLADQWGLNVGIMKLLREHWG